MRVVRALLAIVIVVLVATWLGRMQRCRAELATQAAVEAAGVRLGVDARTADRFHQFDEARFRVARYCDAPV
jgi:hypothetical protein